MEKSVLGLSLSELLLQSQLRKASLARLYQACAAHVVPSLVRHPSRRCFCLGRLFHPCFGVELKEPERCRLLERGRHVDTNQNIITITSVFI